MLVCAVAAGKVVKSGWQVVRPMDGFVSQLALLARGLTGRVVRSKRGFGLPGDYSEMSLPFL